MTKWPSPPGPPGPPDSPGVPDTQQAAGDAPTAALGPPAAEGPRRRAAPARTEAATAAKRIASAVAAVRPSRGGSVAIASTTASTVDAAARSPSGPAAARRGPRRARLALRRIDPWSVLKVAFLLSLAMLVVFIVATGVLYLTLDTMGVFSSIDSALQQVSSSTDPTSVTDVVSLSRVIGGTAVLGAVNVLLFTALATLGAFLYNLCAGIAGGIEVTLTE